MCIIRTQIIKHHIIRFFILHFANYYNLNN